MMANKNLKSQVYNRKHVCTCGAAEGKTHENLFSADFARSKAGDMPELISLIEDQQVLDHLKNPTVTKYLREITLDPSKIPSLIDTPELKFLKRKMLEQLKITHPEIDIDAV